MKRLLDACADASRQRMCGYGSDRSGAQCGGASFEMHGLNGAATIGALAAVHAQPERIEAAGHDAEAYYIASECGAIPIEVGHTYLLFLTYDAEDAVYLPVGYEIQCEYIDGRLVSGDGMTKWRPDYNYIENAIGAPG